MHLNFYHIINNGEIILQNNKSFLYTLLFFKRYFSMLSYLVIWLAIQLLLIAISSVNLGHSRYSSIIFILSNSTIP
jgi:hypothetical protein